MIKKKWKNAISNNLTNHNWWKRIITRRFFKYIVKNKGMYIMKEDWDNLIILDACRFDLFEKYNNIEGNLKSVISRGASTGEFLRENFGNKKHFDTVYITGNPIVNYHMPDSFYMIITVWKEGWNEDLDTVMPETMTEFALKAEGEFPDKRLIIHFVQPHIPFIGETRKKLGNYLDMAIKEHGKTSLKKDMWKEGAQQQFVWKYIREKKIQLETIWAAYRENLELTLPHVKELVDGLEGKTVISADHGNVFGERVPPLFYREYGHPSGIYLKNLVCVPWHIIEKESRKTIMDGKFDLTQKEKERIKDIAKNLKL